MQNKYRVEWGLWTCLRTCSLPRVVWRKKERETNVKKYYDPVIYVTLDFDLYNGTKVVLRL